MTDDVLSYFERWASARDFVVVGKGVKRLDALEKLLGTARFVEDYKMNGMLHVRLVKSTQPHALIKGIHTKRAFEVPGVIGIFTAADIPGINEVGYAIPDQPLLADKKVRFIGEPVGLVAAENLDSATQALDMVDIDYEPLPSIYDAGKAMNSSVLIHEDKDSNIATSARVRKGDIQAGFDESSIILENTFTTSHQDTVALEPPAALAIPEEGGLTVITSLQYPHLCQGITAKVLGVGVGRVRVVQSVVGGAFGSKDDMGPFVSAMATLVASKTNRPAMLAYSRQECFTSQCKREPAKIRYKSGVSEKDGKIKAIEVEIVLDCGAYANRAPYVLWRATMHSSGPYEIPNAKVNGYSVYTNKVFQGSFRGFGNPQIQFAVENQMDELAEKLGMDPIDFRLKNILRVGSKTLTGQYLDHSVGIAEGLAKVKEVSGWSEKRQRYKTSSGSRKIGIGVACGWHGISTSRGAPDWSNAYLNILKDGSVVCYTGISELGQGTHTGHAQVVAEVLGLPLERVRIVGGTSDAPDTGATHGSRGTSIGAISVFIAACRLRDRLATVAANMLECNPLDLEFRDGRCFVRGTSKGVEWKALVRGAYETGVETSSTGYFFVPKGSFDEETGQGIAYPAFSYSANIAEVEVDTESGQTRVLRVWPALAAGRIINPQLAEGQLAGAIMQGIGYGLTEELVFNEDGMVLNSNMMDYLVPSSMEAPEVEKPVYVEDLWKFGPFGAKGVAEMSIIPIAPAIINALHDATGVRIREIPATPERVYTKQG